MEHVTPPSDAVFKVCTLRAHCPTCPAARRLATLPIALAREINEMEPEALHDPPADARHWKDRRVNLATCELITKRIKFLEADIYESEQQIEEGASKLDFWRYREEIERDRKMVQELRQEWKMLLMEYRTAIVRGLATLVHGLCTWS